MTHPEFDKRFNHHAPTPERIKAHEAVRAAHRQLAETLEQYVAPGRELSLALTNIEQSMFWANAGIARA